MRNIPYRLCWLLFGFCGCGLKYMIHVITIVGTTQFPSPWIYPAIVLQTINLECYVRQPYGYTSTLSLSYHRCEKCKAWIWSEGTAVFQKQWSKKGILHRLSVLWNTQEVSLIFMTNIIYLSCFSPWTNDNEDKSKLKSNRMQMLC